MGLPCINSIAADEQHRLNCARLNAQVRVAADEVIARIQRKRSEEWAQARAQKPVAPALTAEAQERIEQLQREYSRVKSDSVYADGPAYSQDCERMRRISSEINRIRVTGEWR